MSNTTDLLRAENEVRTNLRVQPLKKVAQIIGVYCQMGQRSNCSKSGRLDMDPLSEDSEPPSSSDSDDTVEDETYEIDPTDLQSDEEEIEYDTRAKEKGKIVLREEDNEAESVDGDLDNVLEDTDFSDEEDTVSESGDSVECGDHIREELQYDAEELIFIREMNRNLRRVQHTSVGPFTTNQVFKEAHAIFSASERVRQVDLNSAGKSVPLDHRDSDEEGLSMNDGNEDSEVEHEAVKTKEGKRNLDYPFFNEQTDMRNVYFEVGLRFQSQKVLKEAILWYSIQQKKDIRYITDTDQWIILCCHGCTWEMFASRDLEHMDTWKINDLGGEHGCVRAFDNKLISASWLTEQFLDKILRNPKMTPREMKDDIQSRYDISVHVRLCRKAKNNALSAVTDLMKHQYGILKPYLRELCISNPGTHCVLKTSEALPGQPAVFQKCYVCFDALRKGFVEICRPIIGVDGCFLKHACGGQLLFAVGRDGNNHMYPVAWAVVEAENRGSWEWFLKLVGEDLNIGFGGGWTVISDQKKGLVESIHALWPNIEHRRCARYVFSDWVKLHKGRELEQQFWRCVKATAMGQFTAETNDLKKLSKDAYDDFMVRDPNTFCKFHFKTHSKCDVVDNNMAETFNSFILLARYKPIITMFEDIRLALMNRMKEKKEKVSKFVAGVPPRISEKLEEAYEEQKNCECRWNGDNGSGFEVLHKGICHAVDLEKRTCSCRVWELTGIPCCHAMNAILYMNKKPEDYIAMWYKVETYAQTYSMLLQSARGNISWDHDDEAGMVLPPSIERRGCGRRNTDRRTDVDECSIKTSPSKVKHDDPRRKQSRSDDSESSTMKRAKEVQAKLSAEYPSFIKCIIHSHTKRRGFLNIPAKFCHEHLPKCNANLELVAKHGKTFSVKYLGNRHLLTAGWNDFSSAHKLDKGDVLVGQLVNKASFQVAIHIIRHNVLAETDGDLGLLEVDTRADVTISSNSESSTLKRAEEVQAKLSAEYPSFSKCIIHSYTKHRSWLSIPAKFCHKHLPKCNANLELVDKRGKTFSVKYLGNKHALTAGWNDFSSAHKLEKGDFLVGQLVNKALFQVEIHIIRHNVSAETDGDLGLLGSDTYADVMISNDDEKNSNAFAKAQEKHLDRLLPCSSTNILENPDYMPPDEMLKSSSWKRHLRSSKYAQQAPCKQPEQIEDEYDTADPSSLKSTSMIPDPVLLQATDMKSTPVRPQASSSSDPVSLQATIDKTPKHRSCRVQLQTCQKATRNKPEQIENEYSTADFHFSRSRKRRRANPAPLQSTNTSSDPGLLRGIEMCSVQFGDHLERIWMSFPADKLVDFSYLECLWFMMYRETCHRTLVLSWIKKKNIFSRKYIFVPICIWGHWNLLILCHFGESVASESKKPFMLLLDSLHKADPMRYGPEIRKFVMDIFKEEGISYRSVSKIRLLVPKVPQQKNKECGYFTLYYMKKFIEATLETVSDDDLTFINENWFSHEELDGFCMESKAQELLHSQEMALDESSTDGDVICLD